MSKKNLSYLHASSNQELGCQENVCKGLQVFPKCLHMAHKDTEIMLHNILICKKSFFVFRRPE